MSIAHSKDCPGCHDGNPLLHNISVTAEFNLNRTRTERVNGYIEKWRVRLGLTDWDIRYNPDRKFNGKGSAAECTRDVFRQFAEIGIHPDCPESELESSVVHELLHIVTGEYADTAKALAGKIGDKRTGPFLLDQLHTLEERVLEQLAVALTERPMIPWWHKKKLAMFQVKPKDAA